MKISYFIVSNYNIISNNSENKYGTATLIRTDFDYKNVRCDTSGRALVFDVEDMTFGNFYGHSGTDSNARSNRESFLLINSKNHGCLGGDLNMIIDHKDAICNPAAKMSPVSNAW